MLTITQNTRQTSNLWQYKFSQPMEEHTYLESTNYTERVNSTTLTSYIPLIKKETETSNQTTNFIFQVAEKDKKRIINKLLNKDYNLLFYTIASTLKEIPNIYQDYYIKVHLERDKEIENWEETVFSIIIPNMNLNDKAELWGKIEDRINNKVKEIKSNRVNKLRGNFTIEID